MAARRQLRAESSALDPLFLADRRDRHPGTHFADELGSAKPGRPPQDEPHVDEDLGCSEFGIDLPFLDR